MIRSSAKVRINLVRGLIGLAAGVAVSCCTGIGLDYQAQREALVAQVSKDLADAPQLSDTKGFRRAMAALGQVRREEFVSRETKRQAYDEQPQPIGYDQTISSPYIVGIMTAVADPPANGRVLEIGTGSGYQAAVLAHLTGQVYTIEIVEPLAKSAEARLRKLRYKNVHVRAGDGFAGWPSEAPFDAIVVTAGAAEPPLPLLEQLAPHGRMIMPIGPSTVQERLMLFTRDGSGNVSRCVIGSTMFVPLTGQGARPGSLVGLSDRNIGFCYGSDLGRWYFGRAR